jgi:menaquinone-specific isochorismate synthase
LAPPGISGPRREDVVIVDCPDGPVAITTRELLGEVELVSWLPAPSELSSWVKGEEGLVGWGEAARFTARGPRRFAQARDWWSAFAARAEVRDEVGVPGTGLVAFVSMAFADHPDDSVLVVPRVVVGRRGRVSWITTTGAPPPIRRPVISPRAVRYQAGLIDDAAHRRAVAAAVTRIEAGEARKVVLARDLVATADGPLDERYLLSRLARNFPDCWVFAVKGLVGATPELLVRRQGHAVSARLLAGTAWPEPGMASEEALAAQLLGSAKNRREHEYGVRSLTAALAPLCSWLDVPAEPSALHLPNVTHLATDVTGWLKTSWSLLDLAAHVHPTAAVAGTPTVAAMRLIHDLEAMSRGGYLGPVGWMDGHGNGELGVALRCAQVTGAKARMFAGGGIVADSDPDTEAAEAAAKFRAFQSALAVDRAGGE